MWKAAGGVGTGMEGQPRRGALMVLPGRAPRSARVIAQWCTPSRRQQAGSPASLSPEAAGKGSSIGVPSSNSSRMEMARRRSIPFPGDQGRPRDTPADPSTGTMRSNREQPVAGR